MNKKLGEHAVELGLGTWGLAGEGVISGAKYGWAKLDSKVAIETIREAFDLGIRFYDTADFYGLGLAEELLAKALSPNADVVIASKGGMFVENSRVVKSFNSTYIEEAVHASLKRLRRQRIDVYQLHGPHESVLWDDSIWSKLEMLVRDGKIGEFGVALGSSLTESTLRDWINIKGLNWLQIPYSVAVPDIVNQVEESDFLEASKIKLIGRSLFHHGILLKEQAPRKNYERADFRSTIATPKFIAQVEKFWAYSSAEGEKLRSCLSVAMSSERLSTALVGASNPSQIRQLVESANLAVSLSSGERDLLLKQASWSFSR